LVGLKTAVGNFNLVPRLLSFDSEKKTSWNHEKLAFLVNMQVTDYLEIEDWLVYILGVCLKSSSASLASDSSLVMY